MAIQRAARISLLLQDEAGATATEYAIMLVLIILVAFATIIFLGQKVDEAFNKFVTLFNP